MRVLALVPGGIGDQLLFFPTLDDLKQTYPQAQIDVVVEPRAKVAYQVSASVNRVLTFDFKGRNGPADWINLLGVGRDQQYDYGLSLGSRQSIGLLLWLMGIPHRIGFTKGKGNFWLTDSIPLKPEQYAAAMYHDLLQGFEIDRPCPPMKIQVANRDLQWAEGERQRLGINAYVLIHGGSSQLARQKGINKIYPVSSWQQVIQNIQQKQPDLPVVLVQGPEDQEWVEAMQQLCPDLRVTQPDDIGKLAAMIAGASLMLCTDSGPMHLGVAVQTYLIALFGPTDPAKLLPADPRFTGIKSPTGQIADIPPEKILEQVWRA
jgi:ADP-heptose:LPS heptosyltransferase